MKKIKSVFSYFSKAEITLWLSSILLILISFVVFDRTNYLTLCASLIGATSLIFCAKGNPIGQLLMIIFSIIYGIISFKFSYYGEMITYLGMTGPMALFSMISWIKNPYNENKSEVKVNKLKGKEIIFMILIAVVVTIIFKFILSSMNTANIIPSTISVLTSFLAVYLTFRRSVYFTLAYAINDVVLIVLWIMASMTDISYLSVVICFIMFLANDIYGFINWTKMSKKQTENIFAES